MLFRSRLLQQLRQVADLGVSVREQVRDLVLQRPRIHDLAQRGVGGQGQEVAREVEGARAQRALVDLRLHLRGPWRALLQIAEHPLGGALVLGEQELDGFAVEPPRFFVVAEIGGVVAALLEVLIAGGALLAVPALLDRKSTRLNSSHIQKSRMPSSA